MWLHSHFDPVAVRLGPLEVRWYGLMYLAGFVAGWTLGRVRAARPGSGWTALMVDDLVSWCVLGLVLGARLGYVVFYDLPVYLADPLAIFQVWQGGMSFHGGLVGLCLVCWLFGRKRQKSFLDVADFLAPLGPLGLMAGRIGNFINGELWGAPTSLPWGVVFSDPRAGGVPRHPSQLYEAGLEGRGAVRGAVAVFVQAQAARSRVRPVPGPVRPNALRRGVHPPARRPVGLLGLRLADHGPAALPAHDGRRALPDGLEPAGLKPIPCAGGMRANSPHTSPARVSGHTATKALPRVFSTTSTAGLGAWRLQ